MTIFEFIAAVLDELYAQGLTIHGEKLDDTIRGQISSLSAAYKQLSSDDRKAISYQDPATRFAYVFTYVTAHSDYLVQVLSKLEAALSGPIFVEKSATVSCVGGGPGSDIIAILTFLDNNSTETIIEKLRFYLLDGEQAWADTWTEIDDRFETSVSINTNFQPLDFTKPSTYAAQTKFLNADLFTMIYFFSEVYGFDEDGSVTAFWKRLFADAKEGALFIYIDNGSDIFNDCIDEIIEEAGLEILREETNIRITPSYSEQKDAIGEYISKFSFHPKLQAQISFCLLRK